MVTSYEDNRQRAEGVFLRSVVNQIENLNVQTTDKEQIKQIVVQTLVETLPELIKQPAIAQEIHKSAEKYLSELTDGQRQVKESDLVKAATLVWARSEQEVARALAATIERANKTVEQVFKERTLAYERLDVGSIEPQNRRTFTISLNTGECLEFYVRTDTDQIWVSVATPLGFSLFDSVGPYPSPAFHDSVSRFMRPHFFIAGFEGDYEFTFLNEGKGHESLQLFYRVREQPKLWIGDRNSIYDVRSEIPGLTIMSKSKLK